MLDNLKLGYSGTASEMARLINDSGVLGDSVQVTAETVKDVPFDQVIEAIHEIQTKLGITGTSSKEAAKTIQGSMAATKAAWNNLVTAMANPKEDMSKPFQDFINAIVGENEGEGLINQILPAIETALTSVGELIEQVVPELLNRLPELLEENLPKLIESVLNALDSIINSLIDNAEEIGSFVVELVEKLVNFILDNLPKLLKAGMVILTEIIKGIASAIPELIPVIIECITQIIATLTDPQNLGDIIIAAIDIVLAIVEGIVNNITEIIDAILMIITNIQDTLLRPDVLAKIIEAAFRLIIALGVGIIKSVPEIIRSIVTLIGHMTSQFFNTDWGSIGQNIVNGLLDGLKNAWQNLSDWWQNGWNGLIDGAKGLLGIASPSKVFKKIGAFTAEGFGDGWKDEISDVKDGIEDDLNFDANIATVSSDGQAYKKINGEAWTIVLNIEQFNNNTGEDIEELTDKILNVMNDKSVREGAVYA